MQLYGATRSVFESERYFLKTELVTLRMKRGIKGNYRRDEQEKWTFNELPQVTHAFSRAAGELRRYSYVFIFVSLDIPFLLRSRKLYKLSQLPPGIYFHRHVSANTRAISRERLSERNALKMDFFVSFTYINLRELRVPGFPRK